MKSMLWAWLLVFVLATASVADSTSVSGHWTVKYVSGVAWKTIGGAEFDFEADGDTLTGTANVGAGYPGKAPISNGKIEGDRISFTVSGRQWSSSGFPKMNFVGTINGDNIRLTMTLFYNSVPHGAGSTELEGNRDLTK
jgi:hypothetical protein